MLCISREASGPQHHIHATSVFALTAVKAENDLMRHSSRRLHKTREEENAASTCQAETVS